MGERVTPFSKEEIAGWRTAHANIRLRSPDVPCGCSYGRCDVVDLLDSHDALQAERDQARENLVRYQEWTRRRVDDYVTALEGLHQVEVERDAARAALTELLAGLEQCPPGALYHADGAWQRAKDYAAGRAPGAGEPPLPQGSPGYSEACGVWD